MVGVFSYLVTILAVFYWLFRVIVELAFSLSIDFPVPPVDPTWEVVVLFATLPCLFLVVKRNLIGATLYVGMYVAFFGTRIADILSKGVGGGNALELIVLIVGVLISAISFIDILLNRDRSVGMGNKKTDWFYSNKDFDREFDERADRNQYRT